MSTINVSFAADTAYSCDPRIKKFKEEEKARKESEKKAKADAKKREQEEKERVSSFVIVSWVSLFDFLIVHWFVSDFSVVFRPDRQSWRRLVWQKRRRRRRPNWQLNRRRKRRRFRKKPSRKRGRNSGQRARFFFLLFVYLFVFTQKKSSIFFIFSLVFRCI